MGKTIQNNPEPNKFRAIRLADDNMPLVMRGVTCVPHVYYDVNFQYCMDNIKTWVQTCRVTNKKVILVSAGPSLKKYVKELKTFDRSKCVIACVKHALPTLIEEGVIPDYCVILDPRVVDGISTNGVKRKSLYEAAANHKDQITFLVATITDYNTTKYLIDNGYKVAGWNCVLQGNPSHHWLQPNITYGSCAAVRALQLFEHLGFRQFVLVGYDSSVEVLTPPSQEEIINKKLENIKTGWDSDNPDAPSFWTKGELAVQAQEICDIIQTRTDLTFAVLSDGFIGRCWQFLRQEVMKPTFEEVLHPKGV